MRRIAEAVGSIRVTPPNLAGQENNGAAQLRLAPRADRRGNALSFAAVAPDDRLLVLLGLSHDFLRGEIDLAGREGIADEEIIGLGGVVVLSVLEVRIFGGRQRQFD